MPYEDLNPPFICKDSSSYFDTLKMCFDSYLSYLRSNIFQEKLSEDDFNIFGKIIAEYFRWTAEERDTIVSELNEKLGGAEIKLFIY